MDILFNLLKNLIYMKIQDKNMQIVYPGIALELKKHFLNIVETSK